MPRSIVKRANLVLKHLESHNTKEGRGELPAPETINKNKEAVQLSFFQLDDPVLIQIRDEVLDLDINNLTPIEALNKLNDIKKIVNPINSSNTKK